MKKAALALAALVAFSGAALAGQNVKTKHAAPAACVETTVKGKLDCAPTGSTEKARPAAGAETAKPRTGIAVNPWIMPTTF